MQTEGVRWSNTGKTAANGTVTNVVISSTLTASSNSDGLQQQYISGVFAKGALTGLAAYGLQVDGGAMSATGSGSISTAYSLLISQPTIGTVNAAIYVASGIVGIGDDRNANMSTGLTINQGAATNEILALKNSGVAHGMTALAETDTYGNFSLAGGGLVIQGLMNNVSPGRALDVRGVYNGTPDTTKSTAGDGVVRIDSAIKSGTTKAAVGANGNMVIITNDLTTRFIFDSDGDLHADAAVTASAYDVHNDVALCRAFDLAVAEPDTVIRTQFDEFIRADERRADLERLGLVTFNEDGHDFWNVTRFVKLHNGAIHQVARDNFELRAQVAALSASMAGLLRLTSGSRL